MQIYVRDHLAASTAGIALARRCQGSNAGTPLGDELSTIVEDISADARVLEEIAWQLGTRPSRVEQAAAVVGERVSRLKLNGRLRGYSPLSRVIELESLMAGIDAKRSLWQSLIASSIGSLARFDLAQLVERATDQRRRLDPHHTQAASLALSCRRPS